MWQPQERIRLIQDHTDRLPLKTLLNIHGGTVDKIRAWLIREKVWVPYKQGKVILDTDDIVQQYKNDVSILDIAKKYKCSASPIVNILKDTGVRLPAWAKDLSYTKYELLSDKKLFQQKAVDLISKKALCEYYGVGMDMIVSLCDKHQIQMQNSADTRSLLNRKKRKSSPLTKDEFITQHFKNNNSVADIATAMGISTGYLQRYINTWQIQTRDTRISLKFREFKKLSTKHIQQLVDDIPITMLYKKYEVSYDVFRRFLTEINIKIPIRFTSSGERSVGDFIESTLGISVVRNNRKLIHPYELDIYIPSHNLAIEYCGLYWHSELQNRGKDYHIRKFNMCKELGIQLITIFEDEYLNNIDLIHNKLASILGSSKVECIHARTCDVREISPSDKRIFLDVNHVQGNDTSSIKLGLFFDNILVSVMTFAKPSRVRSSVKHQQTKGLWELNRFASHCEYNVRGAAGKLLSYFKKNYDWSTIYSYADKRWSQGALYHTLGFTQVSDTSPNYWYVPRGYYKREYRYNYAKYKLIEQGFDSTKTEKQIMLDRGFTRVWDCGHHKFEMYNIVTA